MEQTNGFQSFRTRIIIKGMGNVSLVLEMLFFHGIRACESERLKVPL